MKFNKGDIVIDRFGEGGVYTNWEGLECAILSEIADKTITWTTKQQLLKLICKAENREDLKDD